MCGRNRDKHAATDDQNVGIKMNWVILPAPQLSTLVLYGFKNSARRDGELANFSAERRQRVVDRICDGRARSDRTPFSNSFLAEIGVRRRGFHMNQTNIRHII